MKTKQPLKTSATKTPLLIILQTIEQYYEQLKEDPVLSISAMHLWHAAEDIRVMRALALETMLEVQSDKTGESAKEGESEGVWTPLSCISNYGLKQ